LDYQGAAEAENKRQVHALVDPGEPHGTSALSAGRRKLLNAEFPVT
jgi:hypothetical protein